jgi:DNA-binding LytR/AlgR family response regulator
MKISEDNLNKLQEKIKQDKDKTAVSIKYNEGYCRIDFDSLIYVSSHRKRTTFHTTDKEYIAAYLMKTIENMLPDDKFVRVHRQYIINLKYLREIRYYEGGRYLVYLNDADESILPVGRYITSKLKEKLGI